MRRLGLATSIAAAALGCLPAASHAAVAGLDSIGGDTLVYAADVGEANDVLVSREGDRIVFRDEGATIAAGRGCTSVAPNRVTCAIPQAPVVEVHLEDGDDRATTSGDVSTGRDLFPLVHFEGGTGSDELRGSADRASLTGGPGQDVLAAGPGTHSIDAVERLGPFFEAEMPPMAPEPDQVTCVPFAGAEGQTFDGVSVDERDAVSGPCQPISLYTPAFIALTGTDGRDFLSTPPAPSRIDGLGGDDSIGTSGPHTRAAGGPGNDALSGRGLLLGGDGDDRLDAGFQSPAGGRLSGDGGADRLAGSNGPDRFVGGPGFDRISARGGNDLVRVRDGERDKVRCGPGRDTVIADRVDRVERD